MNQQASYLLREFFSATHWNTQDNYPSLTHSSRQLLDFSLPPGLNLSLASRPTDTLSSALNLSSLASDAPPSYPPSTAPVLAPPVSPLLAGQLTYLFSSAPVLETSSKRATEQGRRLRFKDVLQSYPLGSVPVRPELREEALPTWQGGQRVDKQDFLLYGRLYFPSPRLDALFVRRLTPTLQTLISLITVPSPSAPPPLSWESTEPGAPSAASTAASKSAKGPLARLSELELKLQQDTGRWSAEYSYAVGDGMWGVRGLYNFGSDRWGGPSFSSAAPSSLPPPSLHSPSQAAAAVMAEPFPSPATPSAPSAPSADCHEADDDPPTGLKGRWSAGGEIYFSAQERSAGVSTGLRFTTIPELAGGPPQPPTTATATLNPIMGQLSAAYAVQVGRDSALASRFDFNMYSYDAELTVGGEWFQRKGRKTTERAVERVKEERKTFDAFGRGADEEEDVRKRRNNDAEDEVLGVLKVRASTNSDVALLWQGRMGDFLVSVGAVADLRLATHSRGRVSPIRSVGLGISYWA